MRKRTQAIHLAVGPVLLFLCMLYLPSSVFPAFAARTAIGSVAWMAYWWIAAPVDYAVTALLPIALNALFPMAEMSSVIANYAAETILLLLGASILTASWDETGLDRRIAAKILSMMGSGLRRQIVFWFLLCTLLSSILPNAVVCAAITPIAVSMLRYVGEGDISKSRKGSLLLLTIVYAVGVGGLASPLGGAMNLITVDYLEQVTGQEYMYASWVIRFLPIMIVLVASNILILLMGCGRNETLGESKAYFTRQYQEMPPIGAIEKWALALFLLATALSFMRQFYQAWLPGLKPAYVFIVCAIVTFLLKDADGKHVLHWKSVQGRIGWDLMYVFAGGLAAGTLVNESGAAAAIGELVSKSGLTGGFGLVFAIVLFTVLLSDITSNTATAAVAMPIVINVAQGLGENPIPYIYIASIGVNLSYMLPTSIRAIPVGYGLEPRYMLKKGVPITIVVIVLMSVMGYLLLEYWSLFSTI